MWAPAHQRSDPTVNPYLAIIQSAQYRCVRCPTGDRSKQIKVAANNIAIRVRG